MRSCISQYYSATRDLGFVFVREVFIAVFTSVSGKEHNMKALNSGKISMKGREVVQLLTLPTKSPSQADRRAQCQDVMRPSV